MPSTSSKRHPQISSQISEKPLPASVPEISSSSDSSKKGDSFVYETIKCLKGISDQLPTLSLPIDIVFKKVDKAFSNNENIVDIFDEDTILFMDVIKLKLENLLEDEKTSFIQRLVFKDVCAKIVTMISSLKEMIAKKNSHKTTTYSDIDLKAIAAATHGQPYDDVTSFIKNLLRFRNDGNVEDWEVFDVYRQVQNFRNSSKIWI